MVKRRKSTAEADTDQPAQMPAGDATTGDGAPAAETQGLPPRPNGPWDLSEMESPEGRIDFGGVRIRGIDGMQVQAQVDERTGAVSVITLMVGDGQLQVQAFAAPRSTGLWADVRKQLMASITGQGGLVDEAAGEFGTELRARVPGQSGLSPVRFVGVDGPRWFLRGLFIAGAAVPGGSPGLEQAFRDIVVVRGTDAMAPGDVIALQLPATDS